MAQGEGVLRPRISTDPATRTASDFLSQEYWCVSQKREGGGWIGSTLLERPASRAVVVARSHHRLHHLLAQTVAGPCAAADVDDGHATAVGIAAGAGAHVQIGNQLLHAGDEKDGNIKKTHPRLHYILKMHGPKKLCVDSALLDPS